MAARPNARGYAKSAVMAFAAVLVATAIDAAPARAQPYLGWDFGSGFGIGIGTPPSAYNPCPNYGWPIYPYPYRCRYHPRPVHPKRHPPPAAWTRPPPPSG